jgi:antitoxin (DNA-binding transcriptional repressor) of toxin-antitoxin stability system
VADGDGTIAAGGGAWRQRGVAGPAAPRAAGLGGLPEQKAGEAIQISRLGKPAVQLSTIARLRKPITLDALRAVTDTLPQSPATADEVVRAMRDQARY